MTPRDTPLLEMAKRYEWFCQVGWSHPVLNDPRVIHGEATAKDIDHLIADGMHRWPLRNEPRPAGRCMIRFQFEYPTRDEYWTMYAEDFYRLHCVGPFDRVKDFVYAVRATHDELVLLKALGCLDADV